VTAGAGFGAGGGESGMASSSSFVAFALDLLAPLGPVQARAMFGGHGLYARGVMFGLLDDDELFLKTDAETRERFVGAGCRMWVYPGMAETHYYRPPDEAHEDPDAMLPWARLGLEAALRAKAAKERRARETAERRAARAAAREEPAPGRKPAAPGAPASRAAGGRGSMAGCEGSRSSSSSPSRAGSASGSGSGSPRRRSARTRRRS
jgi:DNA transformation protein